jgi:hypothetical protein
MAGSQNERVRLGGRKRRFSRPIFRKRATSKLPQSRVRALAIRASIPWYRVQAENDRFACTERAQGKWSFPSARSA